MILVTLLAALLVAALGVAVANGRRRAPVPVPVRARRTNRRSAR